MPSPKKILQEVLEQIQPDKNYESRVFEKLGSIISKINKNNTKICAILGGSGAKKTHLKAFDADIFVLFDYKRYSSKSDKISDILEAILKKKFKKVSRLHGSRDYFQIKQAGMTFEIVPILKIKKAQDAKNITDVSPLHSRWVLRHKKLVNDIRLAKQFAHAQGVYGAESYIKGFSGYVCEIMAIYYGSFLNLLKRAAKWKIGTVIDAKKYYEGKDVFAIMNLSKLSSPLIIIDPVQKERNAAAALGIEKFTKFKRAAALFLKNPSGKFFEKENFAGIFEMQKKGGMKLVKLLVQPLEGKTDIVGAKMLKIFGFLNSKIKNNGFKVLRSDWEWDKKNNAVFYLLFDKKPLPKMVEIEGPPVCIENHAENFKKKHRKTFVRGGKIFAKETRKFTQPENFLRHSVRDPSLKFYCKSIKLITG